MRNGIITNAVDWRNRKLQGYAKFQGLPLSIENERGSYRQGTDEHGNLWRTFMHIAYGYVRLTLGVDGDHVDVYIGSSKFSDKVFIVHQNDPFTGKYDEDKCMLGFNSHAEAKAAYQRQYDRSDYYGTCDEVSMAVFKQMLKDRKGLTLKPPKTLQKAKYIKKQRDKHGNWRYEYPRDAKRSSKVKPDESKFVYIISDKFNAIKWAAKQDSPKISVESILRKVGSPEILRKIADTESKLKRVRPTVNLHRLSGDGSSAVYDQTRTEKHAEIIQNILSKESITKARPAKGEKPLYIILGGRGGSGKSWFDGKVYDPGKCIVLDSDKIKGMLEEYEGWNAFEVHEESNDILEKISIIAQSKGLNIVVDGTLKATNYALDRAREYKAKGYSVECHYMHLARDKAAERAVTRFAGKSGRYVPVDVLLSNTTNEFTFEELKQYTDTWSFRDNSGSPPPKLISESGKGKFAPLSKGQMPEEVPYRKNYDYYDFGPIGDPKDYAPDLKAFLAEEDLEKAKYTRRWKGKDGKWNYEYGEPVKKKAVKPVYSQGEYTAYATDEKDMYKVIGSGHEDTIYSLKGVKRLIERHIDMERLGFTSVTEYVNYKNTEYRKKIDAATEAKDKVAKKETEHKSKSHTDKPLYIDMEALQKLSPMDRGRVSKTLDKKYNSSEGILTLRGLIESGKYTGKESQEVPKVQFNRIKYNRMNQKEQDVYEEKLKEKKTIYSIKTAKGTFMDVPKSVYSLISIGDTDLSKSKYIKKFWRNGKWHYTYDENGSRRPKLMPSHAVHKNLGGTTGDAFLISMPNGERKVMKHSTSQKHLVEEYTANRIYKILGVPVPSVALHRTEKGVAQIADFIEGTPMGDLEADERYDAVESLKRGFVADALLGNWDVLGMDEDNILWDGSKAWRIDNGGAMRYRAQGESKGEKFAGTVGELETMRNPERGAGRRGYSGVTEEQIMSQINNVIAHKRAILQAVVDPKLRKIMEARINSLTQIAKSMNWVPNLTLLKSDSGTWHLYDHGMLTEFFWFHGLEKAIKTKSYYSPDEVKARGMRWVTIRGARVLLQGTADGGYVVVGGAGGKLNHLKIDKILSKEEYSKKRGKVEAKRTEDLRKLTKEELAEQVAKRRVEVKAKKVVRAAYTEKVTEVLGITQEEIRSEISAKQMDELANKAKIMVEGRAKSKTLDQKALDKEIKKQTEKELDKAVHKEVKNTERQALETLMRDYMPDDPNAKPELKKLLDHDKAVEVLAARKEYRKQIKAIGKNAADIPTDLKVGDVFAGASDVDAKEIEKEVRDQIETQKNIRLYDTMNAQSLSIQKHVDEGAISALNGLIGDLYGTGGTFSSDTIAQLGLEAVVRSVAIKVQQDGRGGAVKKALEEYAANEREKVVTKALKESEKRFKNADELRSLARDTDDAEAILSMASANGHALNQLTAGQRALGTAVGSLRAVAHLTAALDDPPADVVQMDIGKDLARARKKAQKAGLPKGSYSIKTLKEGRAKRLVLEIKKDNINTFFQRNEEMRKSENLNDRIKRHEENDGYKPEGIKDSINFDAAQEAGLRFFKENNNVILDFEAGLGKTGMAYAAMMEAMQNKGAKKILVVTPAKTRGDFKSQSKTFLNKDMQKMVLSSTENTTRPDRHKRHAAESGIHIVSQDSLANDIEAIRAAGYDMIVVDEIHEMTAGSGKSDRYQALTQFTDIPLKIAMSGTNIKNKKKELYRKINFVNPDHTLGTMAEFEKRYKGLNQGTGMFADAANDAFRKEMSPYMYTQKNTLDVENTTTTKRVAMTPTQRKAYAASERLYRDERADKVPGASGRRDSRNYNIITDGKDINNGKLNELVDTMNTKHPEEKAVIHVSRPGVPVLDAMRTTSTRLVKEYGENSVAMIHGDSGPGEVADIKKRFNNSDDPLRFIVGTKSLESGHNLQGGGTVTFHLDIPDSYASFQQRNARVFRKNQDKDTSTYVLSGANPYDMRGEDIMETKRKEMGILGNPREIESMDATGFLGMLNKYEMEAQGATA